MYFGHINNTILAAELFAMNRKRLMLIAIVIGFVVHAQPLSCAKPFQEENPLQNSVRNGKVTKGLYELPVNKKLLNGVYY
jgi:hypothetical protein